MMDVLKMAINNEIREKNEVDILKMRQNGLIICGFGLKMRIYLMILVYFMSIFWQNEHISVYNRCAATRYFQIIGSIHDIEYYFGIDNTAALNVWAVGGCYLAF